MLLMMCFPVVIFLLLLTFVLKNTVRKKSNVMRQDILDIQVSAANFIENEVQSKIDSVPASVPQIGVSVVSEQLILMRGRAWELTVNAHTHNTPKQEITTPTLSTITQL